MYKFSDETTHDGETLARANLHYIIHTMPGKEKWGIGERARDGLYTGYFDIGAQKGSRRASAAFLIYLQRALHVATEFDHTCINSR